MKRIKVGYFLIIVGLVWTSYKQVIAREEIIVENHKIAYTLQDQAGYLKKEVDIYDVILEIPQIHLKKGIYKKEDKRNHIDKNVTIHEASNYPNQEKSNIILMAHSGTGENAYFQDLYQLNENSLIKIYYQNIKYTYKISHYYEIDKNGFANIQRDQHQKTITLITCSQKNKSKQLVYIGYLIDET